MATERAVAAGRTIDDLGADDFLLPTVAARAVEWSALLSGRGFVLLRGFPTDRLDRAAVEIAYLGLGLHLGKPVGQDAQGTLLGHVRDEGVTRTDPSVRLYRTRASSGLPHRRRRPRRAAVPAARGVGRREPDRQLGRGLQRVAPPPARPDRRAVCAVLLGPQRRAVRGRGSVLRAARLQRRERCASNVLHRLVHPRRATTPAGATTYDGAARSDGTSSRRSRTTPPSTSRWTSDPAMSNCSTTPRFSTRARPMRTPTIRVRSVTSCASGSARTTSRASKARSAQESRLGRSQPRIALKPLSAERRYRLDTRRCRPARKRRRPRAR